MTAEEFIGRLEGVQQSGGGWVARCPAHGDDNPSLSIAKGEDGRVLVHCHAGCTAEEVVTAVGLKLSDLMPPKPDSGKKPERTIKGKWGKWVEDYVYTDEGGAVLYKSSRYVKEDGKKTFIIKIPDAKAKYGWKFGLSGSGIKRVPFHLPRILSAAKAGKSVFILEGEKDVLNFEAITRGAATCNVAGAMKWGYQFPEDWVKWFEGAQRICIIADNDPATKKVSRKSRGVYAEVEVEHRKGQKHAWDVRRRFIEAGFTGQIVTVVMPAVGETQPKDFTDWVDARKAAGLGVERDDVLAALQEAVKAGWPKEWEFDQAQLEAAAEDTGKGNRGNVADGEKAVGDTSSNSAAFQGAGRFGRRSPRSPSETERYYMVDYQITAGAVARFEIGENHFRFEGWLKSEAGDEVGEWKKQTEWDPMTGTLTQFLGMAVGCIMRWDRNFKVNNSVRYSLFSSITLAWFRARGQFFADANNPNYETSLYFDSKKGILYLLRSNEFASFLATMAEVNREDKLFKYMQSLIDDFALDDEQTPRVVPSKQWDRKGDVIYISNGDSRVCRISADKIEDVQNGTDGVVFIRGETFEPWQMVDGPGEDPFKASMLFRLAALEKETDRMNCRLWWLNLFACHSNKPILLVTGPRGCGKTRLLQGMKQFLGMRTSGLPDDTVTDIDPTDKGVDAFWPVVDKGRFEIFDNFDAKIKWAENSFQVAATNGSMKRRELYKTRGIAVFYANSYIGITSNNPIFTTEGGGLPDRIVTARIGEGRKVSVGAELKMDIDANRNQYLTWLARILSKALADTQPVDENINRRHPDFGIFSIRCARAFGDEDGATLAMRQSEIDKAILPLTNDTIAKEIVKTLLTQETPGSWRFTASEMSDAIIKRFGEDESDDNTKKIYGARRIGKAINKLVREFSVIFKWSSDLYEGRTRYDFTGLTMEGKSVFGGFGGFGGLNSEKSPCVCTPEGDFSPMSPTNPPNPPSDNAGDTGVHARASTQSTPFGLNKDDNGELSETEDWSFDL